MNIDDYDQNVKVNLSFTDNKGTRTLSHFYKVNTKDKINKYSKSKSVEYCEDQTVTKDKNEEFWDDVKEDKITASDSNAYFDDDSIYNCANSKNSLVIMKNSSSKKKNLKEFNQATSSQDGKINVNIRSGIKSKIAKSTTATTSTVSNTLNSKKQIQKTGDQAQINKSNLSTNINAKKLLYINTLYQKEKQKEEKLTKLRDENEQLKNTKELENCTFKPKINNLKHSGKNVILNNRNELSLYDRSQLWHNKKSEKIEKEKKIVKLQENLECTFAPDIFKNKMQFEVPKTIDKQTKKYFDRVNIAKKMKEEINMKLNPDYNEKYEKMVKNRLNNKIASHTIVENNSAEDIYGTFNPNYNVENSKNDFDFLRQTLHSQLHSMNLEEK